MRHADYASPPGRSTGDDVAAPYGGLLKELYLPPEDARALKQRSASLPGVDLNARQLCNLELLLNGAFSPLDGFLGQADYARVVEEMRLADGTLWPIPITLDVSEAFASTLLRGNEVALRDSQGVPLAVLEVSDIYRPDRGREAEKVLGSTDRLHPGVAALLDDTGPVALGGRLRGIQPPEHHDFRDLRDTPRALRKWFADNGWNRVVAFQTHNPMHRAHFELTLRAAGQEGAKLLIQPSVGHTRPGDIDHYTRVRCYRALLPQYPPGSVRLSLLPLTLAMHMGGPREAILHAIIRKNYGASHFIVAPDHAGPADDSNGKLFHRPSDAQSLLERYQDEIGIRMVSLPAVVYAVNRDAYLPATEVTEADEIRDISGAELRTLLDEGTPIPPWFSFPEVVQILRQRHPVKATRGFALFFTGLSGAGKSTIAQAVVAQLLEQTGRAVTVLDGDEVRKHLSRGLGFSREDRASNVTRIGYVAGEIARHGGIAVCAPIAPHADARAEARALVEAHGAFIEIHVVTSLEVCEARDRKGLYALARAGKIAQFTGINDPYEVPVHPDLRIDGNAGEPAVLALEVLNLLRTRGLIAS